jgi:Cdc6-like AAA superfamily ATPase|tara:strand:+ start:3128 stop:3835 length:708 start_codon:yes stop_codon:yes gene_type:complete
METMELPKEKVKASRKSPKNMIIYGPPKIGKTTMLSLLNNCLIIDLEDGSDMVDALKIKANSLADLQKIGGEIIKAGKPYKYVAIDTISKLEEWCEGYAKAIYKKTPMGKNFDSKNENLSVLSLPNGAGYLYLRMAYKEWMDKLNKLADHVILVGHLKDKMLEKQGKEVAVKDLDLTGKIKQITCANADAVGYIYREGEETMISFNSMDDVTAGSRCAHLKGATMPLAWDQIFID